MSFKNHCKLLNRIAGRCSPPGPARALSSLSGPGARGNALGLAPALALRASRALTTQVLRPYVDPKLSYAYGRSQEHLIYSTIARELERQVETIPDELAFISHYENISVTHRQFYDHVSRLAKSLATKFNICKGDFVGVFAYNCYNWLLVQYACSRLGAILTPINPSYKAQELAYILEHGKVKCLFMPGFRSPQAELNDHRQVVSSPAVLELFARGGGGGGGQRRSMLESVILLDSEGPAGTNTHAGTPQQQQQQQQQRHTSAEYSRNELELAYPLAKHCKFFSWHEASGQHAPDGGRVFRSAREADEAGVPLDEAFILSPELVSPDDLFAVYYTSGTTGKPKGACCSQFTVVNNVHLCQVRMRHGRPRNWKIVQATTLPMFHIFAGVLNAFGPVLGNATLALASYKYDIDAYLECIIRYGANLTALTPTMLIDLLTRIERTPELAARVPLKIIQPGGAMLAPELVGRAFRLLPQLEEVRTGYGSTENGAVATFQSLHEPDATKASTVGPPIDFTEVRVVRPGEGGDGPALPFGERGEIQTRGHNTMIEYLNEPAKTREVITPNRWYRTGDIGYMHPHGSIVISGRLKHMIIKGGENIYPEEVEQMMHEMDCIEKVHVVGVPDERFGEQLCAWVKLQPGFVGAGGDYHEERTPSVVVVAETATATATATVSESEHANNANMKANANTDGAHEGRVVTKEQVLEFCKQRITYFKVPKYLFFVQDFPMTPTKKVQNHKMVERSIELLGLKRVEVQ